MAGCSLDQKSDWCKQCSLLNDCIKSVFLFVGSIAFVDNAGWASVLHIGNHEKTLTGTVLGEDKEGSRAALVGFLSALKAFKSSTSIYLFTNSEYLWDGVINGCVGNDGKNQSLWAQCDQYSRMHKITAYCVHSNEKQDGLLDDSIINKMKACKIMAQQSSVQAS